MQIRIFVAAEAGCGDLFNLEFDEFFDGRQILFFRRANQRSGIPKFAGTTGAADAMNIILGNVWQFVVDDMRQVVDIQTARGHVGADEYLDAPGLEGFERFGALLLALVAMDGVGLDALAMQIMREATGAELKKKKNQYLTQLFMAQDMHQQMTFVFLSDGIHAMGDGF